MAGLAFTPSLYACGVDIVGPSNIKTLLDSIPAYWGPLRDNTPLNPQPNPSPQPNLLTLTRLTLTC